MLSSIIKKSVFVAIAIGFFSSTASAYTITYHDSSIHERGFFKYKKNHHKNRIPRVIYYSTNNPNISIMIKNPTHVSKYEIKKALRSYIRSNRHYTSRW